jgi:hypothetical protein
MVSDIAVARTTDLKGGDVAGECDAGSPGSDGASPYPELRPTCAETPRVNLPIIYRHWGERWAKLLWPLGPDVRRQARRREQ